MVKIYYIGHSAFIVKTQKDVIFIDPFISGNPWVKKELDYKKYKPTLIIVTHAHGDHLGDAVKLSKAFNTQVWTNFEISNYISKNGGKSQGAYIGGKLNFDFGWIKFVQAVHGSSFIDGSYGGVAMGVVLNIGGIKIYHAGDTGLTNEFTLLQDFSLDYAMLPIGGHFTMDIDDAVKAVDLIKPKFVIPMHYDTFPLIKANPEEFKSKVEDKEGSKVLIIKPGTEIDISLKNFV